MTLLWPVCDPQNRALIFYCFTQTFFIQLVPLPIWRLSVIWTASLTSCNVAENFSAWLSRNTFTMPKVFLPHFLSDIMRQPNFQNYLDIFAYFAFICFFAILQITHNYRSPHNDTGEHNYTSIVTIATVSTFFPSKKNQN